MESIEVQKQVYDANPDDYYQIKLTIKDSEGCVKEIFERPHVHSKPFLQACVDLIELPLGRERGSLPLCVRDWIKHLDPSDADELWEWLDSEPDAIQILVKAAAHQAPQGEW